MKRGLLSIIAAVFVSFVALAALTAVFFISNQQEAVLEEFETKKTADQFADAEEFLSETAVDAVLDSAMQECCSSGNLGVTLDSKLQGYFTNSKNKLGEGGFVVTYSNLLVNGLGDCTVDGSIDYSFKVVSPSNKASRTGSKSISVTVSNFPTITFPGGEHGDVTLSCS